MKKLVFLDIETSGLDPNYHEPIEVAWVTEGGLEKAFSLEFDTDKAERKALEVNGFGARPFAPVMSHFNAAEMMARELSNTIIVANNVAFDIAFLTTYLRRNGRQPSWANTGFELKSLVAGHLGVSPALVSTTAIQRHFGIQQSPEERHTALGDARWNRAIYYKLGLFNG